MAFSDDMNLVRTSLKNLKNIFNANVSPFNFLIFNFQLWYGMSGDYKIALEEAAIWCVSAVYCLAKGIITNDL